MRGMRTVYPHRHVQLDLEQLDAARAGPAGRAASYWGAQGEFAPYLDVTPALEKLDGAEYGVAAASVDPMIAAEVAQLDQRLDALPETREAFTALLRTVK